VNTQRLFIVGSGPLPGENSIKKQTAFGLRTWQFLAGAKDFSGSIKLVLLNDPNNYEKSPQFGAQTTETYFGKEIEVIHLQKNTPGFFAKLKKQYQSFNPTVCAGVNLMPAFYLSKLNPTIPFWADLNGWSLAETS